jgi:hypothetical protein
MYDIIQNPASFLSLFQGLGEPWAKWRSRREAVGA